MDTDGKNTKKNKTYVNNTNRKLLSPIETLAKNIKPTTNTKLVSLINVVLRVLACVPKNLGIKVSSQISDIEAKAEFNVSDFLTLDDAIQTKNFSDSAKLLEKYKLLFEQGKAADSDSLDSPKKHLDIYTEAHIIAQKLTDLLPEQYQWLGLIASSEALSHRASSAYYYYSKTLSDTNQLNSEKAIQECLSSSKQGINKLLKFGSTFKDELNDKIINYKARYILYHSVGLIQNPIYQNQAIARIEKEFLENSLLADKIVAQITSCKRHHDWSFCKNAAGWIDHHRKKKRIVVDNMDDLEKDLLYADQYEYFKNQNNFLTNMGWITLYFGANSSGNYEDLKNHLHKAVGYFEVSINHLVNSAFVDEFDDYMYPHNALNSYLKPTTDYKGFLHDNLVRQLMYSSLVLLFLSQEYEGNIKQEYLEKYNEQILLFKKLINKEQVNGIKIEDSPANKGYKLAKNNLKMIGIPSENIAIKKLDADIENIKGTL